MKVAFVEVSSFDERDVNIKVTKPGTTELTCWKNQAEFERFASLNRSSTSLQIKTESEEKGLTEHSKGVLRLSAKGIWADPSLIQKYVICCGQKWSEVLISKKRKGQNWTHTCEKELEIPRGCETQTQHVLNDTSFPLWLKLRLRGFTEVLG